MTIRWTTNALACFAVVAFAVGCDQSKSTAVSAPVASAAAASATGSAPAAMPVASASTGTAAAVASAAGHPSTCEVEVFGRVDVPKPAAAPAASTVIFVAQDDCLSASAAMLGHAPLKPDGSFFIEIFPKWGTDITICAAAEKADGTAEYYGKAVNKDNGGKFHAETVGEVTFEGVNIALKKGPSRKFALR